MRSAREIRFRIAQQLENARLYVFPPAISIDFTTAELPLPAGDAVAAILRRTPFAEQVQQLAGDIAQRRFRVFEKTVETGTDIQWRKDYLHDRTTGTEYFRFIPYLDFEVAGDHKNVWELNRHQHLVLLAQAWLFTRDSTLLEEIGNHLESWFEQNPFLKGINYTSALEIAFRALSWLWVDHLVGPQLGEDTRRRLRNGLFRHGHFLNANLSTYFSPNTHLLGEGVALYALGLKFPETGWARTGSRVVREEAVRQIQNDGSHFEQSTYYHVYALDFFLFYYVLAGRPEELGAPLRGMATYLASIQGPTADLNFFGDDDGGRVFHPYGDRSLFGRATLTTCALLFPAANLPLDPPSIAEQASWWIGSGVNQTAAPPQKEFAMRFPDSGLISIARGGLHFLFDAGKFGPFGAGHSHSDTLSFTIRTEGKELLIDPGTFTYVADPEARDAFRGSGYHSTIRVDGKDQADPNGPFRWENKPQVECQAFFADGETVYIDATCTSRGVAHRRRFFLVGARILFVLDDVSGPQGTRSMEQLWHLGGQALEKVRILSTAPAERELRLGWRSRCLGSKEESPVIAYRWEGALPVRVATAFLFEPPISEAELELRVENGSTTLRISGTQAVEFPASGVPRLVAQ